MGRIRLFPLLFQNGCSQSLSIPAAGQKDRRLWGRECCVLKKTLKTACILLSLPKFTYSISLSCFKSIWCTIEAIYATVRISLIGENMYACVVSCYKRNDILTFPSPGTLVPDKTHPRHTFVSMVSTGSKAPIWTMIYRCVEPEVNGKGTVSCTGTKINDRTLIRDAG